ncbi:MAG: N4-gp56 family major capsid protein [Pseudomonadota bacterium]
MSTPQTFAGPGISQRTNVYAERQMLRYAMATLVLEKTAKNCRMPKNKSDTVKFRRPVPFKAVTSPLVEGVTPTVTTFEYEDVTAVLRQYGEVASITDKVEDLHEDPVLNDMVEQLGENVGRTKEALDYGVVRAGTNVFFANGVLRSDVNTTITTDRQRAVIRALRAQKAKKFTKMLDGSPKFQTKPIENSYIAIGHTDLEADIRNMVNFTPTAEYGSMTPLCNEEIGAVEDVRYILSPDLEPFQGEGSTTLNGMLNNGTNVDVYPLMYFGQESWGTVALRDQGAITPSIIPPGQRTKDDPLGQRGVAGWKTYHAAVILNQLWMARAEVGASDLAV